MTRIRDLQLPQQRPRPLFRGAAMDPRSPVAESDRPCPLPFVVSTVFASALLWLYVLLSQLSRLP
jgi:hypothetical protein